MRIKNNVILIVLFVILSFSVIGLDDQNLTTTEIEDLIIEKENNMSSLVEQLKECILIKNNYQEALEDYDETLILRSASNSNDFNHLLKDVTNLLNEREFTNSELTKKLDLISIDIDSINIEILKCENGSTNKQEELKLISNDLNNLISSSVPLFKYSIISSQEEELNEVLLGLKRSLKKIERKNERFEIQEKNIGEVVVLTNFLEQKIKSADEYYLYSQNVSSENLNVMINQKYLAQEKVKQEIISTKEILKNIFKVYREFKD